MRTTLVAVLLWALATIALCAVGLWATAYAVDWPRSRNADPVKSLMAMLGEDARLALDRGGAEGLAEHMRHLAGRLPGERFLVDRNGRDMADGSDRSALVRAAGWSDFGVAGQPGNRLAAVIRLPDSPYRFIWVLERWFEPPSPTPFITVVVATITLMSTALALYLSVPLRRLRQAMDRFGKGDLSARVGLRRRDELGVVSREFDLLAERVETLVAAERRLLQDVSHELRSPLTRLDVAVGLAIRREDRGPLLERIRRDVTRLSDLVGELLHLTRAEGDPSARVLEVVPLATLMRTVIDDCAIEAEARGCRLEFHEGWPGAIKGDTELLRRAFENVIRNAIRHAPGGTPIEISLAHCGNSLKAVVSDRGPGVPAGALPSLFEPFFRVEQDRSRTSGGVGLGLAIARRAIALHGGHISARNTEPGLAIEIILPGA